MRCIEMKNLRSACQLAVAINRNMRCIEIVKHGNGGKPNDD